MREKVITVLFVGLLVGASTGEPEAQASAKWGSGRSADVVLEWNQILQNTVPATASLAAPRFYSMLHIAMFDAANTVDRDYSPYLVHLPQGSGGDAEIAAAAAARDVLTALLPAGEAEYDRALAARLGRPSARNHASVLIGRAVARRVLAWRDNDGWAATPPAFTLPPFPGLWQPAPGAAAFTQYPHVKPFALLTGTQLLPPPPPTLTSQRYADDFNEVKRVGSATSAERTADQTQGARLFAGLGTRTNLYMLWNNVARDLVQERGLGLTEAARLFVLLNVGIIDGVQTTMSSKYIYGLWRPVTAIRRADEDLNAGTDADPAWAPLLSTPPYPAYAGNQACVASAAARALEIVAGTDPRPVTAVWQAPDGSVLATRWYADVHDMAEDQARSRVYGGIHFAFDNEVSQQACPAVVDFVADHYMRPHAR